MNSYAKGSNCVKWSRYTTLKINNKHETKVSSHFVFFPVCKDSVLVYPTGFDFFHSKIKALKKEEVPSQKCPHLNVRILGAYGVTDFAKFPVWTSKDKALWVCWGAQSKRMSQVCCSNLKGWSSDAIANSRAFISVPLSCVHLTT